MVVDFIATLFSNTRVDAGVNGMDATDAFTERYLTDRLIERCEDIPDDPQPGNYVVIDVMHFSTTVVELLAGGAEYIHVTRERGDEFDFRERNPTAKIGGGSTDDYDPVEGYDFFNSPTYVQSVDVTNRPVAMTSSNGGRAINHLLEADDTTVYVGSTTNASTLAAHLRQDDRPTHLISAGSKGEVATEDHIGALLIARGIAGVPVDPIELDLLRTQLETAKGIEYTRKHEIRRRDVYEYATAIDSRRVVPRLDGRRLVDVSARSNGSFGHAAASD
jgi:2-phosphosulfolactate phosphatase